MIFFEKKNSTNLFSYLLVTQKMNESKVICLTIKQRTKLEYFYLKLDEVLNYFLLTLSVLNLQLLQKKIYIFQVNQIFNILDICHKKYVTCFIYCKIF